MSDHAPVPPTKATIYRTSGGIALGVVASALGISGVVRPEFSSVITIMIIPLLLALVFFFAVLISRLVLVGFLPADADHLVPAALLRQLPMYAMIRFGFFAGALFLIAALIAALVTGVDVNPFAHALVYVVFLHVFANAIFGAVLNLGIIVMRLQRRAP